MQLNDRSARFFEELARYVIVSKYLVFFVMIGVAGFMSVYLKAFTVDTSTEGLLHETNPVRVEYDAFQKEFGKDELIIAAIGPVDVFSEAFLNQLKAFHQDLKDNVPHLDDITSLINARNTWGDGQTLYVEDFLEDWPENGSSMEDIKTRAYKNHSYVDTLVDQTGRYATVIMKTVAFTGPESKPLDLDGFSDGAFDGFSQDVKEEQQEIAFDDAKNQETVDAVKTIVNAYNSDAFPIHLSGTPVVSAVLKTWMMKDMRTFTILAFLAITVLTYIVFRRIAAVAICLATIGFTCICTFGLMAMFQVPIKIPTILLPSFLLAVSVCSVVHILSMFYKNLSRGINKEQAIVKSLGHSGLAVVLAGVTTAGGLLSFVSSKVDPIEDIGIFVAAGVIIALVYSLLWVPATLAMLPKPKMKTVSMHFNGVLDRILIGIGGFGVRRPYLVLGAMVVLILGASVGIPKLRFSHRTLSWLPADSAERIATQVIDDTLNGTVAAEMMIDTKMKNGLHDPETLKAFEAFSNAFSTYRDEHIFVGKILSVNDILKETNRALNGNDDAFYVLPDTSNQTAQEFLLFEMSGSDDLGKVVDTQFRKTHITLKLPWKDSVDYLHFYKRIDEYIAKYMGDVTVINTGLPMLMCHTMTAIIDSMKTSYIIAFVAVTVLMILFIGNIRLGLISMVPNIVPIYLTLGIMGWMNVRLDAFTMPLGAIAIGLAVDDTIHFMNNFRRYTAAGYSVKGAVELTLKTSGRAMLFTSIILSSGFMIYCFSFLNNLSNFGVYTALTIVFAFLADCLVAPSLISVLARSRFKAFTPDEAGKTAHEIIKADEVNLDQDCVETL